LLEVGPANVDGKVRVGLLCLDLAVGVLLATQAMNLVLVPWLGHAGLSLSIGLGALFNAGLLLGGLLSRGVYRPRPGWLLFAARVGLANLALGGGLAWAAQAIEWTALQAQWAQRAALVAAVLGGVALLYFAVLLACGLRPRQSFRPRSERGARGGVHAQEPTGTASEAVGDGAYGERTYGEQYEAGAGGAAPRVELDGRVVLGQLRASGLLEAVRLMKLGFPTRLDYVEVHAKYASGLPE
jgi:hypothetical protein